jgi:hypothetical protein
MAFSSNMYAIQNKCLPEDGLLAQNIQKKDFNIWHSSVYIYRSKTMIAVHRDGEINTNMDRTVSGWYPVVGFDISIFESSGSAIRGLTFHENMRV